ncbi:uncharacterized protein STEHIDRAFT_122146 [Stereum hirsutum FP-91666 SS1]|uniref:uncharacterized protein n=1 Tax=Stereum hirsutum (strain FP-91666) TaxID=721885 RepID=UPI000444A1D0|nr:uncharacterized protein STEHIDRAFT_122146 [Stereum hirsutum FP-91666 SS1]EIM86181.1 hypothetical protein STEHIDRAFT_122146 [Stereum hirsutum FP-91666 SS1]
MSRPDSIRARHSPSPSRTLYDNPIAPRPSVTSIRIRRDQGRITPVTECQSRMETPVDAGEDETKISMVEKD